MICYVYHHKVYQPVTLFVNVCEAFFSISTRLGSFCWRECTVSGKIFYIFYKNPVLTFFKRTTFCILFSFSDHAVGKQKSSTDEQIRLWSFWSEWRESNSRPLEPHSSALPKLRYTRISTAASLPKRGDMKYYTQIQQFCQQIFTIFFAFFVKSLIFAKVRALFILLFFLAGACLFPKAVSDTGR